MLKTVLLVIAGIGVILLLITGVRLALLKHSLTSYDEYWKQRAAEPAETNSLVYIALGDSTAQGIGASSPQKGYVGLMTAYLQQTTGRQVQVINISVSGAKIRDVIDNQLPQLKNLPKPDVLTIEAGANDMGAYNEARFAQDFSELLSKLPAGSLVSDIPSFRGGRKADLDKTVQKANNITHNLLSQQPELVRVELYAATKNQNVRDYGADLFHPGNHGYTNWARAFEYAHTSYIRSGTDAGAQIKETDNE